MISMRNSGKMKGLAKAKEAKRKSRNEGEESNYRVAKVAKKSQLYPDTVAGRASVPGRDI